MPDPIAFLLLDSEIPEGAGVIPYFFTSPKVGVRSQRHYCCTARGGAKIFGHQVYRFRNQSTMLYRQGTPVNCGESLGGGGAGS